jgi:hypothetical protein
MPSLYYDEQMEEFSAAFGTTDTFTKIMKIETCKCSESWKGSQKKMGVTLQIPINVVVEVRSCKVTNLCPLASPS